MPHYLAHSANASGEPQGLLEHTRNVAERAASLARPFGGETHAFYAGLWHDLGKFHPAWQEFVRQPQGRRGPDHSSAGMVLAARLFPPLASLVAGHHGGVPNLEGLRLRLARMKGSETVEGALEIAGRSIEGLESDLHGLLDSLPSWLPHELSDGLRDPAPARRWELYLRFVFSALVDADFLDTEAHFDLARAGARGGMTDLAALWRRFEEHHATKRKQARATELNRMRTEIYEHCLAAAQAEPGLFRLTVPTGGGKTLSGMAFALRHALTHGLRRVVVAIPYTSIIEQTADVYRDVFRDGVLEHHSAVAPPETEATNPVGWNELWRRLASENWDAPIIVSTTVQLFESLFSNRPSACRKLHNLAGSVVVLDEAQTLPPHFLAPILDALRDLTEHFRMSVVFCTATQPAVAVEPYSHIFADAREIVPDPGRYFDALRRVSYQVVTDDGGWTWARVAEEMRGASQCLAIVNTKRDALALVDALGDPSALHLSTSLCAAHRREVLAEVRKRLEEDEPCRLVSTQVVEAGVDLDFPLVLRAMGPLDRIVQAAGRCNREGRLGPEGGRVVVFDPSEAGPPPPGAYQSGMDTAHLLLAEGRDLAEPSTYERYFRLLSQQVNLDREEIQSARARWQFPEVAERFRMIDDDSVTVAVPYPSRGETERLLDRIRYGGGAARALFRELQPFVVTVRKNAAERHARAGLLEEVVPGLYCWLGKYDQTVGLVERAGLSPEELVV